MQIIRYFISFEAAAFFVTALVHFGFLVNGYEHLKASIAETVIGTMLVIGLVGIWICPAMTRTVGLTVHIFAFIGTLIGGFTIAVGIGPRTVPDVLYHIALPFCSRAP
jgi:hypothetical protein